MESIGKSIIIDEIGKLKPLKILSRRLDSEVEVIAENYPSEPENDEELQNVCDIFISDQPQDNIYILHKINAQLNNNLQQSLVIQADQRNFEWDHTNVNMLDQQY